VYQQDNKGDAAADDDDDDIPNLSGRLAMDQKFI
jgi:hypothetical protein